MRLENYKTKLLIWSDKDLMLDKIMYLNISGKQYTFKVFYVKETIIEIGVFIPYTSIENPSGPIEKNLKDMIYYDNLYDPQSFFSKNFFFKPEFVMEGETYSLRIAGSGPVALRLLMDIPFSDIDKSNKPIERKLRDLIVRTYEMEMENNSKLEERFEKVLEKNRKDKLRKEKRIQKTKEKEKRTKELEDEFDLFKPRDKSRYKIR